MNDRDNLGMKEDIFAWWHRRRMMCPKLNALAIKYLIIPATSAESERVFSTAGLIIDEKRNKLSNQHLNTSIFLYKNLNNRQ